MDIIVTDLHAESRRWSDSGPVMYAEVVMVDRDSSGLASNKWTPSGKMQGRFEEDGDTSPSELTWTQEKA